MCVTVCMALPINWQFHTRDVFMEHLNIPNYLWLLDLDTTMCNIFILNLITICRKLLSKQIKNDKSIKTDQDSSLLI